MAETTQNRATRKARRRVDGNFHIRSIGGDVRPVPGLGTADGEQTLVQLASRAYRLASRSAAKRRRLATH
jgi:hypothetical protein